MHTPNVLRSLIKRIIIPPLMFRELKNCNHDWNYSIKTNINKKLQIYTPLKQRSVNQYLRRRSGDGGGGQTVTVVVVVVGRSSGVNRSVTLNEE